MNARLALICSGRNSTGVFRAKGVEAGKPYVRRERFVDTWIYKGGNWVCVATNATPVLR